MIRTCWQASLLALSFMVSGPPDAQAGKPEHACKAADALPADANDESRRIVCEIPAKYQRDVFMAQTIGAGIRRHDMAAWLTTDALQEIEAFKNVEGTGRGWLTIEDEDGIDVRYFTQDRSGTHAVAAARLGFEPFKVDGARKLSPPAAMSERERRLMQAKMLALSSENLGVCTNAAPNTVVLENEENGIREILVFVMSAWTEDVVPLGGYHMFRVSEDGSSINSRYSQTDDCPIVAAKQLAKQGSLRLKHRNSATPTMFHVFMSLQYRKPILVSTTQNGLSWRVDQGRISLIDEGFSASKTPLAENVTQDAPNPERSDPDE